MPTAAPAIHWAHNPLPDSAMAAVVAPWPNGSPSELGALGGPCADAGLAGARTAPGIASWPELCHALGNCRNPSHRLS